MGRMRKFKCDGVEWRVVYCRSDAFIPTERDQPTSKRRIISWFIAAIRLTTYSVQKAQIANAIVTRNAD